MNNLLRRNMQLPKQNNMITNAAPAVPEIIFIHVSPSVERVSYILI